MQIKKEQSYHNVTTHSSSQDEKWATEHLLVLQPAVNIPGPWSHGHVCKIVSIIIFFIAIPTLGISLSKSRDMFRFIYFMC